MIAMLKEIILDFQEIDLPTGVPRRVAVLPVPGKATVCIGVRRSGKSTFMFQLMSMSARCCNLPLFLLYDSDTE
jgi:hypothetical protein